MCRLGIAESCYLMGNTRGARDYLDIFGLPKRGDDWILGRAAALSAQVALAEGDIEGRRSGRHRERNRVGR